MTAIDSHERPPRDASEAIVYLVFSPTVGPEYRIFIEEDMQVLGGIHAIERLLEAESYWFVRLGEIRGESTARGFTMSCHDIARLPTPPDSAWQLGRRNPAFRASELERYIFRATFKSVARMLHGWKQQRDGMVEAYALKALKIGSQRLATVSRGLQTLQRGLKTVLLSGDTQAVTSSVGRDLGVKRSGRRPPVPSALTRACAGCIRFRAMSTPVTFTPSRAAHSAT